MWSSGEGSAIPVDLRIGGLVSHIDGRRQRRLSKNKDYKKRYGCRTGSTGTRFPSREARHIDRRRLNRQVQALRNFTCDGTVECVCPACDNDELVTAYTARARTPSRCACGGRAPAADAVGRLTAVGKADRIEPLLRGVPGLRIDAKQTPARPGDGQPVTTTYTAFTSKGLLTWWEVDEPT